MTYYDKASSDELKDKFKDLAKPTGADFSGLIGYFDKGLQGMDATLSQAVHVNTNDIEDGAVTAKKRTNLGETGIIYSTSAYPDFNFNNKTLTIKPSIRIFHRDTFYTVNNQTTDLVINLDDPTFRSGTNLTYGIITFYAPSETFRVRDAESLRGIDEAELILGSYKCEPKKLVFMNGPYTIDGVLPATTEGLVDITNFPSLFEVGTINTSSNGQNAPSTTSIRSKDYHLFKKGSKLKRLGGQIAIWFYDIETKDWLNGKEIGYPGPVDYSFSEDSLVRFVINGYGGSIKETLSTVSILQYSSDVLNELTETKTEEANHAQPYYVNDSGKDLVFKFPITLKNSYKSDHTFVGDELWIFPVSNDSHTSWSTVMRYSVDAKNKTATLLGTFDHNWGHANSVDYNENTDSLVCGNGGGSGNTQPDEFYVFENASQLKNIAQVDVHEHAIVYQVEKDGFDWGKQLNTTWGQANGGKYNIVYVLSNYNSATGKADNSTTSSDTQVIHKVLLGQGANKLENGTFIDGKSGLEYNGTYKVLKEYTHPYEYDYANQGTTFYNGVIYEGIAHDRLSFFEKILDDSGKVKSILNRERLFNDAGAELGLVVEGLAIKDDLLYLGEAGNSLTIYVYKL